jgi:RimJ/RimL family protein N-acetyltransferase
VGVVIEAARAAGARRLVLDVAEENAAARALYERVGFTPTGRTWDNPEHGGVLEREYALVL